MLKNRVRLGSALLTFLLIAAVITTASAPALSQETKANQNLDSFRAFGSSGSRSASTFRKPNFVHNPAYSIVLRRIAKYLALFHWTGAKKEMLMTLLSVRNKALGREIPLSGRVSPWRWTAACR